MTDQRHMNSFIMRYTPARWQYRLSSGECIGGREASRQHRLGRKNLAFPDLTPIPRDPEEASTRKRRATEIASRRHLSAESRDMVAPNREPAYVTRDLYDCLNMVHLRRPESNSRETSSPLLEKVLGPDCDAVIPVPYSGPFTLGEYDC